MSKEVFDFYDKTSLKSYNLDKNMQYQLNILGSLDVFTRKHSENVASVTVRLCEYLHLSKDFTQYCTICAYLHDIGKQFIPSSILQKKSRLTDEEYKVMKTHTTLGYNICMNDLKLRPYAAGPIYHHEALNGVGYPRGLTRKDIPIEGQIIRVADEFDAMVSKRQYKSHIEITDVVNIMLNECKPIENPETYKVPVKDPKVGLINPIIFKALLKVLVDDTEYEISCIMDYIKELKTQIKRLSEVEKYDKKRLSTKNEKKQQYYLEGMKMYLVDKETVENYQDVLNSYRNIVNEKTELIDKLFNQIKTIKKVKV